MKKKKAKQTPPPLSPTADGAGGDDRISALDDDLCELILRLAHLNVRELARTSVLSKRWRSLWKRLPVLDFFGWPELRSAGDVPQYIATVNDVLEQRAGATSEARIDEVKIPLLLDAYSLRGERQQLLTPAMEAVEAWIRYAMHHPVKGLQLNLRLPPLVNKERRKLKKPVMDLDELLPSPPKLECMRLGLSHTKVRLPRTAVFTSLKDLTLEFVELAAGSGHLLARLSSAACCPSLQKLRMMRHAHQLRRVDQGAGARRRRALGECVCVDKMGFLELRTPKLLHLEINECDHLESLRVSAPGLKELTYIGNTAFIHDPLPCLRRLKIDLFAHMGVDDDEEDEEEDPNSSNICLLNRCSSSIRCLLVHLYVPRVRIYLVRLRLLFALCVSYSFCSLALLDICKVQI